LKFNRSRHCF